MARDMPWQWLLHFHVHALFNTSFVRVESSAKTTRNSRYVSKDSLRFKRKGRERENEEKIQLWKCTKIIQKPKDLGESEFLISSFDLTLMKRRVPRSEHNPCSTLRTKWNETLFARRLTFQFPARLIRKYPRLHLPQDWKTLTTFDNEG